ncbi:hypothetical protein ACS0TY_032985 [Phlomoides rotata]
MEHSESNTRIPVPDKAALETTDDENDSPIEEVRLTVPITDDPTLPCLTFRTWVLGTLSCAALAFLNQFFGYRQNFLSITSVSAQILVLPLGKFMAATLPTKVIHIPGTKWSFTMNPGPFNVKEHCLITIFANTGSTSVYAVNIITIVKAFYHRRLNPIAAMLLTHSTQMLGYGWAGIFRKFLVDSPYMWWPSNLVQVSLFRALHEVDARRKGGLTRLQFFIIVLVSSFSYYIIPNYLFPSITALSFVCWIWKDSVTAQQVGSGLHGLGLGSFAFDWATVAAFVGSPLATPGFALINMLVGFILVLYVFTPIAYWSNLYNAKRFPIISSHVFDANGAPYNISEILTEKTFEFNHQGYDNYSKVNLSIFFIFIYGLNFASLAATLSHVALFHGREIWQQTKASYQDKFGDVHTRLMRKNYEAVPQWWFHTLLVLVVAVSLFACEGFGRQLQLPYWGVLLAMALAFVFTLPVAVITATTNQVIELPFMLITTQNIVVTLRHHSSASRNKRDLRDDHRLHVSWEASSQCSIQNIRHNKHVTSHHISFRFQARPLHEDPSQIHVPRAASGNHSYFPGMLRHSLVAPHYNRVHLRSIEVAPGQPLDVPGRRRFLQRLHNLGRCGSPSNVREAWAVRADELLLPLRSSGAGARLVLCPEISGEEVD